MKRLAKLPAIRMPKTRLRHRDPLVAESAKRNYLMWAMFLSAMMSILMMTIVTALSAKTSRENLEMSKKIEKISNQLAEGQKQNGGYVRALIESSEVDHQRITKYMGCLLAAMGRGEILNDPSLLSGCEQYAIDLIPHGESYYFSPQTSQQSPAAPAAPSTQQNNSGKSKGKGKSNGK